MSEVRAWQLGRRHGTLRGDPDAIAAALAKTGAPFRWVPRELAYVVPLSVFDRLLAEIENAGHRVTYKAGLW